jgi:hypothetical protein
MMKSPLVIALVAGVVSLLLAFVPVLWHMRTPGDGAPAPVGTPWQVAQPASGHTQVFGLDLPGSTLADAVARWGDELQVGVIASLGAAAAADRAGAGGAAGGGPALESYLERFSAGGVDGRLLLSFDAGADALARWRDRLPATPISATARRHALDAATLAEAGAAPLVGIGFIPAAQLDAAMLRARFGEPAERIADGERLEHWLYPAIGLAVVLDARGRELLQYVAPAEFEARLARPLRSGRGG